MFRLKVIVIILLGYIHICSSSSFLSEISQLAHYHPSIFIYRLLGTRELRAWMLSRGKTRWGALSSIWSYHHLVWREVSFLFPLLVDNYKTLLRTLPTRSRTCWTNLERAASQSMSWTGNGGGFRSVIVVIDVIVVDIIVVFVLLM